MQEPKFKRAKKRLGEIKYEMSVLVSVLIETKVSGADVLNSLTANYFCSFGFGTSTNRVLANLSCKNWPSLTNKDVAAQAQKPMATGIAIWPFFKPNWYETMNPGRNHIQARQ